MAVGLAVGFAVGLAVGLAVGFPVGLHVVGVVVKVVVVVVVTVVVTEVVPVVVTVVLSHLKKFVGQFCSSAEIKGRHMPSSFLHGPAVVIEQSSQSATSGTSKHRRKPAAQVSAFVSLKSAQCEMESAMQGPNPVTQPSQCSGVVVCDVVTVEVTVVVPVVVLVEVGMHGSIVLVVSSAALQSSSPLPIWAPGWSGAVVSTGR